MAAEEGRSQFDLEHAELLLKRAKGVAVAFFLFHVFTSFLDWVHLDLPFLESYAGKVPMVALSLSILIFSGRSWMSRHIAFYLCLLMLSLQLSVYIKSLQYGDYAPIASLVVFSCMFSAYFIPWSFKYHLVVTIGALLLVSHWMFGFANASDWITAARGTFTVAAVCIATAVLAYWNDGKRFLEWKEMQVLQRNDRMFRQLGEYTSDIVFIWNPDLSIDYVSPSFERYTGRTVKDLLTTDLKVSDFVDPQQLEHYMQETHEVLQGRERKVDLTLIHTNGKKFELEAVASPIFGSTGRVEKAIAVWRDTTERSAKVKSLQQLVNQDPLTKAYNLEYFQRLANKELDEAAQASRPVSFFYVDIDRSRKMTEHHGLAAGNQVVIEVTERCREVLGDDCVVSRYGGDSLLIMLSGKTTEESEALGSALTALVSERPVFYEDHLLPVSICVGISVSLKGAQSSFDEVLDLAAKALYQSKRNGRGSYTVLSSADA